MKPEKTERPRKPRRFRRPPSWVVRSGGDARICQKAPPRERPVDHVHARRLASQEDAAMFAIEQAQMRDATVILFFRYVAIPVTPKCRPGSVSARLRAVCPDPETDMETIAP